MGQNIIPAPTKLKFDNELKRAKERESEIYDDDEETFFYGIKQLLPGELILISSENKIKKNNEEKFSDLVFPIIF